MPAPDDQLKQKDFLMFYMRVLALLLIASSISHAGDQAAEQFTCDAYIDYYDNATGRFTAKADKNTTLGQLRDRFVQAYQGRFREEDRNKPLPEGSKVSISTDDRVLLETDMETPISNLDEMTQMLINPDARKKYYRGATSHPYFRITINN